MTVDITASQLYMNPSLMNFHMREQAQKTFEDVLNHYENKQEGLEAFDDIFEYLDEMEETCYSESTETILEMLGYEG